MNKYIGALLAFVVLAGAAPVHAGVGQICITFGVSCKKCNPCGDCSGGGCAPGGGLGPWYGYWPYQDHFQTPAHVAYPYWPTMAPQGGGGPHMAPAPIPSGPTAPSTMPSVDPVRYQPVSYYPQTPANYYGQQPYGYYYQQGPAYWYGR